MTATALLSRVDWDEVNERVRHEQRNREIYVPPISLFRWWARRPHALIGALLDAARETRVAPIVSDPFSGGGTVALEAARRGLPLYAQDLHPWAITGLASALDSVNADDLDAAVTSVLALLEISCAALYATSCPEHGEENELSHVFWVRSRDCPCCARTTYLFPYSLLTLASRAKGETDGYYGCASCGRVSRHPIASITVSRSCPGCKHPLADPNAPLLQNRRVRCPSPECGTEFEAFDRSAARWLPVLVQRVCRVAHGVTMSHFDAPTDTEQQACDGGDVPSALQEVIPAGIETALLRRAGFRCWADFYPPRQMRTLIACADSIRSIDTTEAIRARLRLALCGAAEMAGYLSRWDRYYPKAFEAMANHRFAALGFACETNLLAHRGRGTLRRRFAQSVSAARWGEQNLVRSGLVRTAVAGDRREAVGRGAILVCGSSERQLPPDGSVDLVLTDPPYFDDVQYAELASLFLAWARAVELVPASVTVDVSAEAVANKTRGTGVAEYRSVLAQILREVQRTLKPRGRLVLTYHNTDIRAWWALGRALDDAGLSIRALAVAEAENSADHSKRNSNAFTSDLVVECGRATSRPVVPNLVTEAASPEARELYAAGRCLAAARGLELSDFIEAFRSEGGVVPRPRIHLPTREKK